MKEIPIETEKSPKEIFFTACSERLDELVETGVYSQEFADEKRGRADLIETNIPEDAESAGREFAEIGMEAIVEFTEGVDRTRDTVIGKAQPLLDRAEEIIETLSAVAGKNPLDKNAADTFVRLQDFAADLRSNIEAFEKRLEEIKKLHFGLQSNITTDGLTADMEELERFIAEHE